MPRRKSIAFILAISLVGAGIAVPGTAAAQSAADAANDLALMLDSANALNADHMLSALEDAADAGQPIALWQLGLMYESGIGVERDAARAFGYFSQIANEHADAPPRGLDADIVAQSFVKIGDYYREGLPDAGVPIDNTHARALVMHAASYFGDADAQYRVGELFLDPAELGVNPIQSARWLSLAARKGHTRAQARLGDLLFWGHGVAPQPIEGLMWMSLAERSASTSVDYEWVRGLAEPMHEAARGIDLEAAQVAADSFARQISAGM